MTAEVGPLFTGEDNSISEIVTEEMTRGVCVCVCVSVSNTHAHSISSPWQFFLSPFSNGQREKFRPQDLGFGSASLGCGGRRRRFLGYCCFWEPLVEDVVPLREFSMFLAQQLLLLLEAA